MTKADGLGAAVEVRSGIISGERSLEHAAFGEEIVHPSSTFDGRHDVSKGRMTLRLDNLGLFLFPSNIFAVTCVIHLRGHRLKGILAVPGVGLGEGFGTLRKLLGHLGLLGSLLLTLTIGADLGQLFWGADQTWVVVEK